MWVGDGTSATYTRWNLQNPDNSGKEDCVTAFGDEGEWNDAPCRERRMFVCSV